MSNSEGQILPVSPQRKAEPCSPGDSAFDVLPRRAENGFEVQRPSLRKASLLGPPAIGALSHPLWLGGFPTNIDHRKKVGTLFLTSLEGLVSESLRPAGDKERLHDFIVRLDFQLMNAQPAQPRQGFDFFLASVLFAW